jgi:hypothetical protein
MGFKFPNERDIRQLQEALDQHELIQGRRW